MRLLTNLLILGCGLSGLSQTAPGQEIYYTFDSDLDSLVSTNGIWQWSNREAFPWLLPDGSDGFAVQYMPGPGDTLYDPEVDIQYGFEYEITFFISSEEAGTTILKIQQLDIDGLLLQDLEEYQSDPSNNQWVTVSGTFAENRTPSRFGIFCQTAGINFVNATFYGCAIDTITLVATLMPATTPEPVVDVGVEFNFDNGTNGWLLGRSNGAYWQRELSLNVPGDVRPPSNYVLRVSPEDVYAGTVLATSPRLRVGDSGTVSVQVDYYLSGTPEYPVYLKLRPRLSYSTFDENVILNMDPFGDQVNSQWLTMSQTVIGIAPGQEFDLVLEGNLGIDKDYNLYQIMVSRVYVQGVTVVPYEESKLYDFSDGLVGWQAGSMDGGKWEVVPYQDLPSSLNIPAPSGPYILMVDRYDIHSGVISIESPPIPVYSGFNNELQIRIFVRGSQVYPVIFRLGLKTLDGGYDTLPFIDLTPQGDANSQAWTSLTQFTKIPVDPRQPEFQLVFEVDLGGHIGNLIAIDWISIRSVNA